MNNYWNCRRTVAIVRRNVIDKKTKSYSNLELKVPRSDELLEISPAWWKEFRGLFEEGCITTKRYFHK